MLILAGDEADNSDGLSWLLMRLTIVAMILVADKAENSGG